MKSLSNGDLWRQEHSFEQILKDHEALAATIAKSYKDKGTDWDDLKQLAHIGLYQAYLHYDPDKAVKFSTYAVYWIKKQVLGAFDDKTAYIATEYDETPGRIGRRSDPRLNHIATACDTTSFNIATACNITLDADHDHASMKLPADMPPLERQIINLSIGQQLSLKEISDKLQLSVERVKQHKQKALRRLKAIHPGGV